MKWCRFQSGTKIAHGVIEGNTVIEVTGSPFESHTRTSTAVPLSAVKLLVPVIPPTFYAMSQYLTLYPGDVLSMGTDGATENMKDGDVVEVEITGIGVLRNPVVRER